MEKKKTTPAKFLKTPVAILGVALLSFVLTQFLGHRLTVLNKTGNVYIIYQIPTDSTTTSPDTLILESLNN